jgi:hypothetical protein
MVLESKIYPNMKANIWYYVAAQWDGSTPLPVQIWVMVSFMRPPTGCVSRGRRAESAFD